ncbi:DUF3368 domain-containing protein [Verrucomicrobiota bacterium]|nr:DUF3368 domain-containing protein [Verrucomicrobiota bacterium]
MLVVSNTSPLSNLAIIGHLELVREQLGQVIIPAAVRAELHRHPDSTARTASETAIATGWLRVLPRTNPVRNDLAASLDLGEAEALTLALEMRASLVLLDESAARRWASDLGLAYTGALGILRRGKQTGRITSLHEQIARLRTQARFFVSPALEKALLTSVGEDSRGPSKI